MSIPDFLKPRLTGARFEGKAIPLEVLRDLAVLEEMVIEVAKWKFLQENPGRERSPRGFSEGVELKLTGLEDGSAKPIISLIVAAAGLFPSANTIYFEKAREAIVAAIAAADRNEPATNHLPATALTYFDRMGRSLRDGEAMEFPSKDGSASSRLTRETRRRLVLDSGTAMEITEETLVRGLICEADQSKMTFEVQLTTGQKVLDIPIDPPHLDTILKAFSEYKKATRVLIQGIGRFNRASRLEGFERVQHIRILEPLDVASRLEELQHLKNGWLDGKGKAPTQSGLLWLTQKLDAKLSDELPLPYIYPTAEGGIQAEWRLAPSEISLEIDIDRRIGSFHVLNMNTLKVESRDLNLDKDTDWSWLIMQLPKRPGVA